MFDLRQFAAVTPDWYLRLHYYDELSSSNDEARRMAEDGAEHGTVVLADHQFAGRGRRGTSWISGAGDGLLFSLILRPDYPQCNWNRIALTTGLGVVTALNDKWAVNAQLKWPNDIYIRNRKCAGILVEAQEDFVVVGIGLNVIASPEGDESMVPAIAVNDVVASPVSREMVLAAVLDGILLEVEACSEDFDNQMNRYRDRCFLTGKSIEFIAKGREVIGKVAGLDEGGALIVDIEGHGSVQSYAQASSIRVIEDR